MAPVVYYLTRDDRPGEVKIGTSRDVTRRVCDSDVRGRRGSKREVTLVAVEPGGRSVERARHAQFAQMRRDGEWFAFGAPIIAHVLMLDQVPVAVSDDPHWMPVPA